MTRSDLVDLTLFVHFDTDAAWRVSDSGVDADGVWLPKSQCEVEFLKPEKGVRVGIVTLPQWLAEARRLV